MTVSFLFYSNTVTNYSSNLKAQQLINILKVDQGHPQVNHNEENGRKSLGNPSAYRININAAIMDCSFYLAQPKNRKAQ